MERKTKITITMTRQEFLEASPKNVSVCRLIRVTNGLHKEYALQPYIIPGDPGGPAAIGGFDYSYVMDKPQLIQLANAILQEFA